MNFADGYTPVPKRRKATREVTQDGLARLERERQAREAAEGLRKYQLWIGIQVQKASNVLSIGERDSRINFLFG
jgi:hypothetical protein